MFRPRPNIWFRALCMWAPLAVSVFHAGAQSPLAFTLLHSFQGLPDGAEPIAPLTPGKNGVFYGTTYQGGANGFGSVFELKPPATAGADWAETVIYSFEGSLSLPAAAVTIGTNGALYGATVSGGMWGYGTAFELTPPSSVGGAWTHTVLHDFTGGADGLSPFGQIIVGANGDLFGTTWRGGSLNFGTIFELSRPTSPGAPWTETVLYNFTNGADGSCPTSGLAAGPNGAFYGYSGIVFELLPPALPGGAWTLNPLHSFAGGDDGFSVVGTPVVGKNGVLYGATMMGGDPNPKRSECGGGCGTVFSLKPPAVAGGPWEEKILYRFRRNAGDGFFPYAGVILGTQGALYGTTTTTAFKLIPPGAGGGAWTENVLVTFQGPNGYAPQASLVLRNGVIYGTTAQGGTTWSPSPGYGVVFALQP